MKNRIDLEDVLEFIEEKYTPAKLVRVLELDIADLVVALEDHISENRDLFEHEILGME